MGNIAYAGAAAALLISAGAAAAADKFIGKFDDWEAHRAGSGADTVCFVATLPTKTTSKLTKRGEAALMVAHFPQRKSFGQVQVKAGFALRKGMSVQLEVGDKDFKLAADGDAGYGDTARDNGEIVAAFRAGRTAEVTFTAGNAKIVDTFSLGGFTKALAAIDKECGRR
jgi:invasion protein IalB